MSSCLNEMYCLANICYVCLEKKSKLIRNINSSSVNEDLIHIIDYLPVNLAWLKTKRTILICEECCLQLRGTCRFLEIFLKNSELLQAYMDNLNTISLSNTENEAELLVKLNTTHRAMDKVEREIQLEDEEIHTIQWQLNIEETEGSLVKEEIICEKEVDAKQDSNSSEVIEETEDTFVNLEDYFVKEENTWKREEADNVDEYPPDNNSNENIDNESNSEISVNHKAHFTNTDCVSSRFTRKQTHARNTNDSNTAAKKLHKCSSCSKSFITKSKLTKHSQIHTGKKSYECAICKKRFCTKSYLVTHIRIHTGEKPYSCTRCKKSFTASSSLIAHMRIHTGEKPYQCSHCKKCFTGLTDLVRHVRIHTGEKPYECSNCQKCFTQQSHLVHHMQIHTGEKPFECSSCKKCFTNSFDLVRHLRIHSGEKPFECSNCKRCFIRNSHLVDHMRIHTSEKPYHCIKCKKSFSIKSNLVRHMRTHN